MSKVKVYQIVYLILKNGRCPYKDWALSLDIKTRNRVDERIRRVTLGNFGDYKNVGKGVLELRFHFGSGYRVYCSKIGDRFVVLLGGGSKKTQKEDIVKAQSLLKEYKNENTSI